MLYIPKGSPYLNPIELCWNGGKQVLLVSEYYETFAVMCTAVSEYYLTVRFKLDMFCIHVNAVHRIPHEFMIVAILLQRAALKLFFSLN